MKVLHDMPIHDRENSYMSVTKTAYIVQFCIRIIGYACIDCGTLLWFGYRYADITRGMYAASLFNSRYSSICLGGLSGLIAFCEHGNISYELILCLLLASFIRYCRSRIVATRFARRVVAGGGVMILMALVLLYQPLPLSGWWTGFRLIVTLLVTVYSVE